MQGTAAKHLTPMEHLQPEHSSEQILLFCIFKLWTFKSFWRKKNMKKKARKSPPTYTLWSDLCVCVYTNYMYTKQKTRLWSMEYSYMGSFIKYS